MKTQDSITSTSNHLKDPVMAMAALKKWLRIDIEAEKVHSNGLHR